MRCSASIALTCMILAFCAILTDCAKQQPSISTHGRHSWTIPHVLRIAEMSDPDTLNPYLSDMGVTANVTNLVYSYLVIADNRGRLIGDLATEVPSLVNGGISRDGRTYIYHLRHNVSWHDGAPFTAEDVAASWQAVMNPHNNTLSREGYDRVSALQPAGPYTVVVRLKNRYPPFVSVFFAATEDLPHPILPAHLLSRARDFKSGTLAEHPLGTGPFQFVSWARGDRIILTRYDRYFQRRPRLARIEIRFTPDAQTLSVELQKHQIDLVPSPPSISELRAIPGVAIDSMPANALQFLAINASKPGLQDVVVRQAIANAVPYDFLQHTLMHNIMGRARNVLPTTSLGYEKLPLWKYDPARAIDRLNKAGWRPANDGVRTRGGVRLAFTIITPTEYAGLGRVAVILQSALKPVGIDIALKTYSYATIFAPAGPIDRGLFDLAYYGDTVNWDPDLYDELACDRWYPRGQNVYRFCDPRVDGFERAGLETDDPAKRASIYRKAGRLIWADLPYIPVFGGRAYVVRSADLHNFSLSPSGDLWNAWQWDI